VPRQRVDGKGNGAETGRTSLIWRRSCRQPEIVGTARRGAGNNDGDHATVGGASISSHLYATSRHVYRWWRPPRHRSAVRVASVIGLCCIGRPAGVSLLNESWMGSKW